MPKSITKEIREELVNMAIKLFLEKGFDRTTTRELSTALGWSKGRLYQYVNSKDDLMNLIIEDLINDDEKFIHEVTALDINASFTEKLVTAIRLYINKNDAHVNRNQFLNHVIVNIDPDLRQAIFSTGRKVQSFYEDLIKKGIKAGEFKTENADLVAFTIWVCGDWTIRRWVLKKHYSVEEYIGEFTNYILNHLGVKHNH